MKHKNNEALTFQKIYSEELSKTSSPDRATGDRMGVSPRGMGITESDDVLAMKSKEDSTETGTVGLALSGGGIRSATFSLGVIQALARLDKLKEFDYLSTVSGGGYIGGWLSGWVKREAAGEKASGIEEVTKRLNAITSPKEVEWLRRHSNYLTPRVGALSMDALTVVATWLRNTTLNLIILVSTIKIPIRAEPCGATSWVGASWR